MCREQGIEIEVLGVQRDNLSLPEYKTAMREVEQLEQQAVILDKKKEVLEQQSSELRGQVQEKEAQNKELTLQAQKLTEQMEKAEAKEKAAKELLAKHDLRAETFKIISKEVAAETRNMKSEAVPVTSLFGGEEYVNVKKSDWNKIRMLSVKQYQEIISWKSMRRKLPVWRKR